MESWKTESSKGRAEAIFNDDTAMLAEEAAAEVLSPVRASKRNAATADQDSLEKATKLKALKNLDTAKPKGTLQGNALALAMGAATTP